MWDDVVKAALALIAALITAVMPYALILVQKHVKVQDMYRLQHYASLAVQAAEQVGAFKKLGSEGKYDYAAAFLTQLAGKAGISLSKNDLQPLIEAGVHSFNQFQVVAMPGPQPLVTAGGDTPAVLAAVAPAPTVSAESLESIVQQAIDIAANRLMKRISGTATSS